MAQRSATVGFMLVTCAVLATGCAGAIDDSETELSATDGAVSADAINDAGVSSALSPNLERDAAATSDASVVSAPSNGTPGAARSSATLHAEGRRILDTCGEPFVARGMEQITAKVFSPDGTLVGLASELVKTGSNAVRLLPTEEVSASDLETLLSSLAAQRVVVYLSPGDRAWFAQPEIRAVLLRHESGIILDAFQEPDYDDVTRWVRETKAAIAELRASGYVCPLTVLSAQFGRDLTTALTRGQEVADSDPLHNVIIGWQAYWGKSGWYQQTHKLSLAEGVQKCATMGFPMQVGIDLYADANDVMDYAAVMAAAQQQGVSWLWWNFWNEWDNMGNNASTDGSAAHLTPAGQAVLHSDPNSIERTAKKACFR